MYLYYNIVVRHFLLFLCLQLSFCVYQNLQIIKAIFVFSLKKRTTYLYVMHNSKLSILQEISSCMHVLIQVVDLTSLQIEFLTSCIRTYTDQMCELLATKSI